MKVERFFSWTTMWYTKQRMLVKKNSRKKPRAMLSLLRCQQKKR